jgi:hypothetical protein
LKALRANLFLFVEEVKPQLDVSPTSTKSFYMFDLGGIE